MRVPLLIGGDIWVSPLYHRRRDTHTRRSMETPSLREWGSTEITVRDLERRRRLRILQSVRMGGGCGRMLILVPYVLVIDSVSTNVSGDS